MSTSASQFAVEIRPCKFGRGVFASKDFAPGEQIGRISGQLLTFREALALGDKGMYVIQVAPTLYIYPDLPFELLNHACSPSAGIKDDIFVVAIAPIRAGEEITFDYSTTMWEHHDIMECGCGSPECRGMIGDFPDVPEDIRTTYLDLGIVQSFIAHCWSCKTNGAELVKA